MGILVIHAHCTRWVLQMTGCSCGRWTLVVLSCSEQGSAGDHERGKDPLLRMQGSSRKEKLTKYVLTLVLSRSSYRKRSDTQRPGTCAGADQRGAGRWAESSSICRDADGCWVALLRVAVD